MAAILKRAISDAEYIQEGVFKRARVESSVFDKRNVNFTQNTNEMFLNAIGKSEEQCSGYWTNLERIVLVGNIYDQLFCNPVLCKESWEVIVANFQKHCDQLGLSATRKRTKSAIQRYFKELKKENLAKNQVLFRNLHFQWKLLKSLN
eukprot:snap_masked-scaffold_11-processed-gene-11.14-mRNA-1 protein AED:1.00 eAED:1.00 QI:0/-1/0/0/-1/1/1/0/147